MYIMKPWGHEDRWAISEKYIGKTLYIKAGHQLSRQYHEQKDETVYVLTGILLIDIGPSDEVKTFVLRPGDSYRILPKTIHRFRAPPDGFVRLIEVSTPEMDDVVRIEDDYGRV